VLTASRYAAVLLVLILGADARALCAGWASTPEARMDCCADEGSCPMHSSDETSGATRGVSQADADRCCASSEPKDAVPSAWSFVSAPAPAMLPALAALALSVPAGTPGAWRPTPPAPVTHVPKHLLLSVLLV
jgi:hypothetical protein